MNGKIELSKQLAQASGAIETSLRNDMMFHMVMSRSEIALKGLISALLGLKEEDVKSATLLNPMNYDEYLQKEIVVDTLVELNNSKILNIEVILVFVLLLMNYLKIHSLILNILIINKKIFLFLYYHN